MTVDRTQILIVVSPKFKAALTDYCNEQDKGLSEVIRETLAELIGYDLSGDIKPLGRRRKYANKDERNAKIRQDRLTEKMVFNELLDQLGHEEHIEGREALIKYLERRKVAID